MSGGRIDDDRFVLAGFGGIGSSSSPVGGTSSGGATGRPRPARRSAPARRRSRGRRSGWCASEVDQGEVELLGVLVDAGAAADDLLELGHRADLAVEHDQPAGLGVDAGGEQPRGGDDDRIVRFRDR